MFTFFSSQRTTFVNWTAIFRASTPSPLCARSFQCSPHCVRFALGRMRVWTATWWRRTCNSTSRHCCDWMAPHSAQTCYRLYAAIHSLQASSKSRCLLALFSTRLKHPAFPMRPSSYHLFIHKQVKSQGPTNSTKTTSLQKVEEIRIPFIVLTSKERVFRFQTRRLLQHRVHALQIVIL